MLTIILGEKDADKYLEGKKFVDYNDGLFNNRFQKKWFKEPFVREVLEKIDHIDLKRSNGEVFVNKITGDSHSLRELSTGAKTLILMYKFKDVIFQARFGDNCTDYVEKIAAKKDITIKADYLHTFEFNYIDSINYINYGYIAKGPEDLKYLLPDLFRDNKIVIDEPEEDLGEMTLEEVEARYPELFEELRAAGVDI